MLLLTTYYCCIIHQLLWFMYRGVFTVGVALLTGSQITHTYALTDYSYFSARSGHYYYSTQIARCVTGLGPSDTDDNSGIGGLYYNGSKIPDGSCYSTLIQPKAEYLYNYVGAINIYQCAYFSTAAEGVYTCTMMSSSMMNESVRFGVYFTGRSESLGLYIPSLNYLSFSCSSNRDSIIIYCNSCYWFFPHIILYLTRFSPRRIHMEEGYWSNSTTVH